MADASSLAAVLAAGAPVARHAPWPRVILDPAGWASLGSLLARSDVALLGLWGDFGSVHAALFAGDGADPCVVTLPCPERRFPSLAAIRPGAQRLERAIRDLYGYEPEGLADERPWLDHGRWSEAPPLGPTPTAPDAPPRYRFLPVEGEGVHQIPVGPVHAGIIEPGHFRFHAVGETVVRLEARLGYVHKAIEKRAAGATLGQAAKLAARVSGDSTVAYGFAFARAAEAALGIEPPPRAVWLRALMAELERIANHFGDIGAICNDASFVFLHAQCTILRERVLRAAARGFGHRLMMDRIVPGGVAGDITAEGAAELAALVPLLRREFGPLVRLYDDKPSLLNRTVTTGIVSHALVAAYGAGGHVGRASGRSFDARRDACYPPYDQLEFTVPMRTEGDVNARVWIRIHEVWESLRLIEQILARLPGGAVSIPIEAAAHAREGVALVEAFRGDVLLWLRIAPDLTIERMHPRDASWFQWPLLEAAIEGNIVADFPLCNKSFNCSYSGHDL